MRRRDESAVPINELAERVSRAPEGRDSRTRESGSGPAFSLAQLRAAQHSSPATSAAAASKYELVSASPTETVATAGDCLLVIVEQTVSTIGVSAIQRAFEWLEQEYESVGYLSFIEGSRCTSMDTKARKLMSDVIRRHSSRIGAAAMVVGGDGFRSTVVRSVITGIHLASRAEHPMRAFAALDPALAWYQATWPRRKLAPFGLREALFALYPPAARAAR